MNNENNPPLANEEDDQPPQSSVEVNYKPIIPSFHIILLIILGSILVLLGLIDMIVFYVVPNNKIKNNKKKYPDYQFDKPELAIVVVHFLLHISLIAIGCIVIATINYDFYDSTAFILLICLVPSIFGFFYILEAVFSGCYLRFIKKEDFTLSQISEKLNSTAPITSMFFYVKGRIKKTKGGYSTCYSKRGFGIPVQSNRFLPDFNDSEYNLDYFYLNVAQKVNMSVQLFQYSLQIRNKLASCENYKHSSEVNYYPFVEGKNVILHNGKKLPSKIKKPNAIASLLFGLGIYPELLEKSIPISKFEQNSYADILPNFNYTEEIAKIDCSSISKCKTSNKKPKM